ncbi:MAG: rhomboid family intramembrane serine protease [Rhizobiaceae bacterium]|nr:rhomboid family intramembrane serine protease [Rhizobiaceae bacterium]MCV0408628.1 rhomboid family intramembrane serine protease [Rhizobiaceae bacterium]
MAEAEYGPGLSPEGTEQPAPSRREPAFNLPGVVLAFILGCVAIHLVRVYVLTEDQDLALILRTAFIPVRYSGQFELDLWAWLSPVTYSLLHGGLAHLAINMIWLAAFGSPLANRIGPVRFVLFWITTSVAAVALHYALHPGEPVPLVGASGAISGMMGAAARFGFRVDRRQPKPAFEGAILSIRQSFTSRTVVVFLTIWMVVNLVSGLGYLSPDSFSRIAWEAHIGGFLAGFLAVRFFDRTPL